MNQLLLILLLLFFGGGALCVLGAIALTIYERISDWREDDRLQSDHIATASDAATFNPIDHEQSK